ncbi:hypothetical protein ACQ4WP_24225 [Janthinobacterium sp. GB4P2]|uniref:hypothetical protein n=1 Tax=Janthinobacterium sp. GB4P2 TaxID=3424189 RepID=UPI003F26AF64
MRAIAVVCTLAVALLACMQIPGARSQPAPGSYSCAASPVVSYDLPADAALPDQDNMNCLAWQEFIALNWRAAPGKNGQPDTSAPASAFGAPSATGAGPATVWETYALNTDVFRTGALTPLPFQAAGRHRMLQAAMRQPAAAGGGDSQNQLSGILQAFSHGWLTAQNGQLTYYEVRLNEEEYDYIVANRLYDANAQWRAAQSGVGIHLPDGSASGSVGAIEVKAAWLPLTDTAQYSNYLTAQASITDPVSGDTRDVVVGLVGLHIMHKTQLGQQFVWATFEHVDNAPTMNAVGGGPYTYYNTRCDPTTDKYQCAVNTAPACQGKGCDYAAPFQVVRQQPIDANTVALNAATQSAIRAANPRSVMQYYQLVSTMWPSSSTTIRGAPLTPLTGGNPMPPTGTGGLANVTLETYQQRIGDPSPNPHLSQPSCLACHTTASISKMGVPAGWSKPTNYSSDYSFLFHMADVPTVRQP